MKRALQSLQLASSITTLGCGGSDRFRKNALKKGKGNHYGKRKLVAWLRLILRNQTVLETMYQPWSYAVTTGFDDTFKLLERLSGYVFDIPVDIAVKQFDELEEAF